MKKRTLALAIVMLAVSLAGCSSSSSGGTSSSLSDSNESDTPGSSGNGTPSFYSVSAGSSGGTSYPWYVGLCEVVNQYTDVVELSPIATGGGTETLQLMLSGECQLGVAGAALFGQALANEGSFTEGDYSDINLVLPMYGDYIEIVTKPGSGITSIADLEGKNFDISLPTGAVNSEMRQIFSVLGYDIEQFCNISESAYAEVSAALQEGTIDAFAAHLRLDGSTLREVEASRSGIMLVPFSEEEAAKVAEEMPVFRSSTIPAGTFTRIDEDIITLGSYIAAYAPSSATEDEIYEITKIAFEHHDEFVAMAPIAEESTVEFLLECINSDKGVTLHPGVVKYLKEIGAM